MTSWQDLVLMVGSFVISAALIPTVLNKHKPAWLTSLLDALVLTVFAIAYATLGLYLGAIAVASCAALWYVLLVQEILILRRKR